MPAFSDSSFFDLIARDEVVAVTLSVDIEEIFRNRKIAEVELPADFRVNGASQTWPVKLSLRGRFRRMNCDFPPLRLVVRKEALRTQGLALHNDLKLVTHCMDDSVKSRENVLREYLAYRIYQKLTPNSMRVQLLQVTYEDPNGKNPPLTRFALLMEDFDELAARLGGEQCDSLGLGTQRVDPAQEHLMAVFEYMISNTDWSHQFLRNIKAVKLHEGQQRILIPYDFDYSGLVNAPYARPRRELGQTSVRHRVFMGNPVSASMLKSTLDHVQEKREIIFELVRSFELLGKADRTDILNYLREFYASFDVLREQALRK